MKINLFQPNINLNFVFIITCVLAIALQIQITLFADQDYEGLRVNLADIFLPFIGVIIVTSLLLKRTKWPAWQNPKYVYASLVGLTIIMSSALLQGYTNIGHLSNWAFINKYIGFIILASYMLLGGWLATNTPYKNLSSYFAKFFCGFFILTLVLSLAALIIEHFLHIPLWIGHYEWDGFMANRNAYMVLALFSAITIEVYRRSSEKLLPNWAYSLFWVLIPFFILFNASRTFWIIAGILLLSIFLTRPIEFTKKILPFIVIGSILCAGLISTIGLKKLENLKQLHLMQDLLTEEQVDYKGDKQRLIAIEEGLEIYKKSNPILGAGLGSYREFQIQQQRDHVFIIDFTALWLLVETGAIGLITFIIFFCLCLWSFYKQGFSNSIRSPFHQALFFFLLAFAAASILHELTYSRFLWFMLGLGLISTPQSKTP